MPFSDINAERPTHWSKIYTQGPGTIGNHNANQRQPQHSKQPCNSNSSFQDVVLFCFVVATVASCVWTVFVRFLCHQDPLLYHLTNFASIDPYFSLMKNGSRGAAEQGNETIMNTGLQNLSQLGNVSDHIFGLDHERGCMVSHAAVSDLGSPHPCLLVSGAFGAHVSAM